MRKTNLLLVSLMSLVTLATIANNKAANAETEPAKQAETSYPEKHIIKDKYGNYGGTLNEGLYGKGAPLNGALDHPDSGYWQINDYYNATSVSTEACERTLVTNFETYQQTMKDSGGIACALMAMNHFGLNDHRIYSEERLLKKYEKLSGSTVKNNGVTSDGLKKLFNSYGLFAKANCFPYSRTAENICKFVKENLDNNCLTLLPYWSDDGYHWYVMIGVDTKCTTLIAADPFDAFDHYQDGYKTINAKNLYNWWLNIDRDVKLVNGEDEYSYSYDCVVVKAPEGFKLNTELGEETLKACSYEGIENHLLPNADGTYGGKMVDPATGKVSWGGSTNWSTWEDCTACYKGQPYFAIHDYYNMDDNGSLVILNHYRAKLQTTASTCGICSTLSALVYYGEEYDETDIAPITSSNVSKTYNGKVNEYKLMRQMEIAKSITVYNRGVANYEISPVTEKWGYTTVHSAGYNMAEYLKGNKQKVYPTYEKMFSTLKTDLTNDNPFLIGWKVGGGHWEVIFGYDDMGTPELYDDVCMLADSSDSQDLWKDGYNTYSAMFTYNHWYNGSHHWNQQGIVFKK